MNTTVGLPDPPLVERVQQLWHDSFYWIFNHSTQVAIAAILGAMIVGLLLGAKSLGGKICASDPERNHWRSVFGMVLAKTKLWFMIAVAAEIVASYAHAPDDLARTIHFVFVIIATLQAAIFARELIIGSIEYRATGRESLGSALNIIRLLVTVTLFAVAIILILSNLGVNVTGLVAGLGVGGISIGLAAQGIFKDLFAALSILFDRPFSVGDLIKFGDVTGRIQTIGLKTTRIRSLDGEEVIMSNDKLLEQQLRNFHGIESRRILLTIPLHYGNSAAKLGSLSEGLENVVGKIPDSRFGHAILTSFDANAVMLELMLNSTKGDAEIRDRVRHQAITATLGYLDAQGIGISYQASAKPS